MRAAAPALLAFLAVCAAAESQPTRPALGTLVRRGKLLVAPAG